LTGYVPYTCAVILPGYISIVSLSLLFHTWLNRAARHAQCASEVHVSHISHSNNQD